MYGRKQYTSRRNAVSNMVEHRSVVLLCLSVKKIYVKLEVRTKTLSSVHLHKEQCSGFPAEYQSSARGQVPETFWNLTAHFIH